MQRAFIIAVFFVPFSVFAQGSLSMTLTPPLFQVTQARGGAWSSNLRVVNTNDFDLVVSATVQDFRPDGESGNPIFLPGSGSPKSTHLMSGWFKVPSGDIVIKRGTTGEIPFTISVPSDADPGGHYAAILVGTRPTERLSGSGAGVSSAISSLFFLRVPGDVIEEGAIRDFYAEDTVVQSPEEKFILRFENKGNVHLVPEGSISITNMWGKERGHIDINTLNTFGNVLPGSTRKFEFDWQGERNPFEFGRYKAVSTLVYGETERRTVYREAYFWVIPWKQTIPIVLGIFGFVWFVMWSVKQYIHKALMLERKRLGIDLTSLGESSQAKIDGKMTPSVTFAMLRRPLMEASLDLRNQQEVKSDKNQTLRKKTNSFFQKLRMYRNLIGFMFILIVGISLIGFYFIEVFQSERAYSMEQVKNR